MAEVMIIGAGAAGLEAGLTLARQGIASVIVEKAAEPGGQARRYNCKAIDGFCQSCGVCLVHQKVARVREEELIELHISSEVTGIERNRTGYSVTFRAGESVERLQVRSILLALGLSLLPLDRKGEFGYARLPGVITAVELETIMREVPESLGPAPRVAFIQCTGSRDTRGGVPYCSRVCCFYVPKLAGLLRHRLPGARTDVFYMDRQRYESIYQHRSPGISYVRAMPGKVFPTSRGRLELRYDNPATGAVTAEVYDWVILCPPLLPGSDVAYLASLLGVNRDDHGFINVTGGVITNREGVFAAGACTAPMSILESITSGQAAAGEMSRYLGV